LSDKLLRGEALPGAYIYKEPQVIGNSNEIRKKVNNSSKGHYNEMLFGKNSDLSIPFIDLIN